MNTKSTVALGGGGGLAVPIGRKAVSELVVQRILDLIKNGQLQAGEKLPSERDLAQLLDVSRPTVREALRALSILGVLEIRHGGGVFVTSLDASELMNPAGLLCFTQRQEHGRAVRCADPFRTHGRRAGRHPIGR